MQLTRLELKGFKSFGDKVVINFDKGITGIVGPNGCGKSNVVDAIRWVLGEQKTRMLRSDKMENIIFNGTKKRKATQLAEVSLTFDNTRNLLPTEYTQVTVTRRYYRSGESEYLLNGVTCRLKDIINLFMDTGIASNSYAIIELKMVDNLLNDKDNSRRQLFEEAAGISKFKTRKKETLRKLEDTDADLERVEDLLFEIEKNLKSLEKQARQAEKYYQVKEEYKALSLRLAKTTVGTQRTTLHTLTRQLAEENERKADLHQRLSEQEALVDKLKADLLHYERRLASRQKTLNEHTEKIRTCESDKQVRQERLSFLQQRQQQLTAQLAQDRQNIVAAAQSLEELQWQKAAAAAHREEAQQKAASLQQEYETYKTKTQGLKEDVTQAEQAFRQQQDALYQLRKSLEIKQMQLSTSRQELEKTAADTTARHTDLDRFHQQTQELETQLEALSQTLADMEAEEAYLEEQTDTLTSRIEQHKESLAQTLRRRDALQNEYNLTKSLVDNLEGFPEAIKFLKKQTEWGKTTPLLSDILTCSDEYRVSIENYLHGYMNYYVAGSRQEAQEAIEMLQKAGKGKAHFFLLDQFADFVPAEHKTFSHAIAAIDVVTYEACYEKLIRYMLNDAYIVRDEHSLPEDSEASFMTQDGRIIRHPFSLSGGSVGLFEGKRIGRAKNLEKLSKQLEDLTGEAAQHKAQLAGAQQQLHALKQSSQKDEIADLQREINRTQQHYATVKTRKEQTAELVDNTTQQQEDTEARIRQLMEACQALEPQVAEKTESLTAAEVRITQLQSLLSRENEVLSEKSAAYNQENIRYYQQESKLDSITQEIAYKEETYQAGTQSIASNQQELQACETDIRELLETKEVDENELLAMYQEKESIAQGMKEAEREYFTLRGDIDRAEKENRDIQRQRENTGTLILELQNKLNSTQLSLSSIKERLSVEFELDLDTLLQQAEEELFPESAETIQQQLDKVRERLQKLGPVNPMAMEAFEEIKQRYDFIASERQDLLQAKTSLMTTIREIDAVAQETFMDAFDKIKTNFVRVFRSLFTEEDDCDLRLTAPDQPLESSIEIMARPKGKRPLTINQLSGGEKTLTATALLFAIYLLKPAPFCIFDEVDAPLDDANIDKFNNIIKKFSLESQFIIVTHNKRTMTSTDVIYGVTMIEQGISSVVPVDLRELQV